MGSVWDIQGEAQAQMDRQQGLITACLDLFTFFLFFFFFWFLGPHSAHSGYMEVPRRLGIESELQLLAYALATAMLDS